MFKAEIIAASSNKGTKIATMLITFNRFILAEFNTHRMFSRNSASSRAIPFKKVLKSVMTNPFIPIAWQKDHKGMQGTEYFGEFGSSVLRQCWLTARNCAVVVAWIMNKIGLTKQLCNRLLEPFMWHTVLVTSTEWENFFNLRCPAYTIITDQGKFKYRSKIDFIKAGWVQLNGTTVDQLTPLDWFTKMNEGQAEIHMMALAEAMYDAYQSARFRELQPGEWHIPFAEHYYYERGIGFLPTALKLSTAASARTSYTMVGDGTKVVNQVADIKLHDGLLISGHASPMEHASECQEDNTKMFANFRGFKQYRTMLEEQELLPSYKC